MIVTIFSWEHNINNMHYLTAYESDENYVMETPNNLVSEN